MLDWALTRTLFFLFSVQISSGWDDAEFCMLFQDISVFQNTVVGKRGFVMWMYGKEY